MHTGTQTGSVRAHVQFDILQGTLHQATLTAEVCAAGVVEDARVRLGWRGDQTPALPPLRRVTVVAVNRDGQPNTLTLLTHRFDLSASMVALIYRHRWQIELFFRWLKCMACFKHFFCESPSGMTMQVYIAILGTLLIAVATGARPSSYDYNRMALAVAGVAPIGEVRVVADKRRAERERAAAQARARAARNAKRPPRNRRAHSSPGSAAPGARPTPPVSNLENPASPLPSPLRQPKSRKTSYPILPAPMNECLRSQPVPSLHSQRAESSWAGFCRPARHMREA